MNLDDEELDMSKFQGRKKSVKQLETKFDSFYHGHHDDWPNMFAAVVDDTTLNPVIAFNLGMAFQHQYTFLKGATIFILHRRACEKFRINYERIKPYLLAFEKANLITIKWNVKAPPQISLLYRPPKV